MIADNNSKDPGLGDQVKRERELRLALVCYGGVSLAVYMHGVSKEILKLTRASRSYHAHSDPVMRAAGGYAQGEGDQHRELDSEYIYFELLEDIGQWVDLRVVVDIVAGASAGGINGIMLARALAHDLSLDAQRDMWLNLADVTELLDPDGRAGRWSKPFMRPILKLISWWQTRSDFERVGGSAARDREVRRKLSLFTRSRWFEPPFSGKRMTEMMLDGLTSLGDPVLPGSSLMPPGHALELFVTTTDFWGYKQMISLHDPLLVEEREHRQVLKFKFQQTPSGGLHSDFDRGNIPGLAFAARATSCFPGAFPPLNLAEIDTILKQRNLEWDKKGHFLKSNFAAMRSVGQDPEDAAFIDGSVLMNKPFALAIKSIQGRAAHREVDRRLVYIDPSPDHGRDVDQGLDQMPGFFSTLKGALSDIPRNQPIRDDLEWLESFNERVRRLSQVVEAVQPRVVEDIGAIISKSVKRAPTSKKIGQLRAKANEMAASHASYAYDGYARLKVLSVLRDVGDWLQHLIKTPNRVALGGNIEAWARRKHIRPIGDAARESQNGGSVDWINFLRTYDARFRIRRLRFILRRLNAQYRSTHYGHRVRIHVWLNEFKARIYDHLDAYQRASNWELSGALSRYTDYIQDRPGHAVSEHLVDEILTLAEEVMDLKRIDDEVEESLAYYATTTPEFAMWHDIITAYLGFSYYDVLTLPMVQWGDLDELDDIKVDRISVNDANTLRKGGARVLLKGTELANFGAFFSRTYRENDYLWGRLSGAERLIDIVVSAAPEATVDVRDYKKRMFKAILIAEAPYLKKSAGLIAELLADLKRI